MAHIDIKSLEEGNLIEGFYAVKDASLQTTSTGKSYIRIIISDASGSISGNMWDASKELFQTFSTGSIIKIRASIESYRGQLQVKVERLRVVTEEDNVDLSIFVPYTPANIDDLFSELTGVIEQIKDSDFRALLDSFFADEDIVRKFKLTPAAKANHHAYIGGLLEHTVSLLRYAQAFVLSSPAKINLDLLLCGIILHDIGKIEELSVSSVIDYTDRGRLLGHLIIGSMMVEERCKQIPAFPEEKKNLVQHLILSHHGKYEYGSPVLPAVSEAFALHYLDNLDAKTIAASKFISDDESDNHWTERSWMLDTMLYKADFGVEEYSNVSKGILEGSNDFDTKQELERVIQKNEKPALESGGLFG